MNVENCRGKNKGANPRKSKKALSDDYYKLTSSLCENVYIQNQTKVNLLPFCVTISLALLRETTLF